MTHLFDQQRDGAAREVALADTCEPQKLHPEEKMGQPLSTQLPQIVCAVLVSVFSALLHGDQSSAFWREDVRELLNAAYWMERGLLHYFEGVEPAHKVVWESFGEIGRMFDGVENSFF